MKKIFLMLLIVFGMIPPAFAQAPGWARGQQLLSITYEDCVRRATLALQAECYGIDHAAGNFSVGMKEVHTAVIICNPVGDGTEVVNIVVGSNADGGGSERQRLQAQMERVTPTATAPCPTPQPPPPQSVLGTWCRGERPAYISQSGNSLTITNESGGRSGGYLENPSTIIASDWEGGLRGKVNSDFSRIDWANGTYWVRCASGANAQVFQRVTPQVEALPEDEVPEYEIPTGENDDPVPPKKESEGCGGTLVSTMCREGDPKRPTYISKSGDSLIFTNEAGACSGGYYENSSTVIASDWEGGLRGRISTDRNRIDWANGTSWQLCGGAPKPVETLLSTLCREGDPNRPTYIHQSGDSLIFTNEGGARSRGYYENSNTVVASDWEGGLRGSISSDRIDWANGTSWRVCGGTN